MRRAIAFGGFATLIAMICGSASVSADSSRTDLKNFQHVFVIMMENTGYNSLIGNANAPWINTAVATFGSATNYFGVIHPSQPNYVAATAGITGNDTASRSHSATAMCSRMPAETSSMSASTTRS